MTSTYKFDRAAENLLQQSIVQLIGNEPFYGCVLARLKRKQTDAVPTIAVSLDSGPMLIYNAEFFSSLPPLERRGVLKHEICHLVFKHFERRVKFSKDQLRTIDICFDLAINSLLKHQNGVREVPACGFFVDMPELAHLKLPERKTAEFYFERLKDGKGAEALRKIIGNGFDEHGEWIVVSESNEDEIRKIISDAYAETKGSGAASLPHELLSMIEKFIFESSRLPWQVILHSFIMRCSRTELIPTRMKPNRRYGYIRPGVRHKQKLEVSFIVDTSGSVGEKDFRMFVNELGTLIKHVDKINLIHCDTVAYDMGEFRPGINMPGRRSRGGTEFGPGLRMAEKQNPDLIIYMTDGYASWNFEASKLPVLWVITTQTIQAPDHHGRTLHMK